jgi:uncharacterized protein (TIGR03437 family)
VVNGGSSSAGILTFNPSTISLSATAGGAAVTQSLGITSSTSNSYTVTASTQSGGSWLSINAYSVMGGQTLTVTADPNGLAAGTYQGTLTFSSGQTVSVGFTVAASGVGSGNVAVTATGQTGTPTLTFAYQSGGTAPAKQTLHIANASGGTARIPFSVSATSTPSGWISTSYTSSATTPYDLDVTVSPTGLPVGTYHGVVRFDPKNGAVISVPVTLNVTLPPVISATPGSLTFAYQSGGTVPDAVPVAVSGGGAALTFTATAASTGNWLTVTPTSGTTAAGAGTTSLSVSVSPASLQVGTYNGTIVVAGSGSATGSSTINVTLTVTAPLPVISKVVNAATQAPGAISPGLLISIYAPTDGKNPIGPATAVQTAVENGFVKTTLGGVQVLFNNIAAPLTYVSATQINAVVPYELKGVTSPFVQVKFNDQPSNSFQLTAATTAPGLFTTSGTGVGQAAIVNQNNTVNGSSNPAAPGSVVTLYLTGEGETSPAGSTGKVTTVASSAPLTPQPLLPLGVTIDGQPAAVKFWGEAPSMVSGVLQINVEVPSGAATGSLPVVVSFVGGGSSQTGVTIAVRR